MEETEMKELLMGSKRLNKKKKPKKIDLPEEGAPNVSQDQPPEER